MALVTVFLILGGISLIVFIDKCAKHRSVGGVFIKNITSIFFVLTAVAGLLNSGNLNFGGMIIVGLVFGMLGDIYLDRKWVYPKDMEKYLYAGFISFGIGHIFYMIGIVNQTASMSGASKWWFAFAALVGVIVAIGNLILEKPMKRDFGDFKLIVTIYSFILASMVACSVIAAIITGHKGFVVYAVGSVLFLVSDLVLSPMYFGEGKNTPVNFIINHSTYYIGRFMIATSIALLN